MPCDQDGWAQAGHMVSEYCWCTPMRLTAEQQGKRVVIIVHTDMGAERIDADRRAEEVFSDF